MYTPRRRNALFCVPFSFVFGERGLWSDQPESPIGWRRLVIRSVGLEKRMEKRLKSGLEPHNFTS